VWQLLHIFWVLPVGAAQTCCILCSGSGSLLISFTVPNQSYKGCSGQLDMQWCFTVSLLLRCWALTCWAFFGEGSSSLVLTGMAARVCRGMRRSAGEPNVGSQGMYLTFRRLRKTSVPPLWDFSPSGFFCKPIWLGEPVLLLTTITLSIVDDIVAYYRVIGHRWVAVLILLLLSILQLMQNLPQPSSQGKLLVCYWQPE